MKKKIENISWEKAKTSMTMLRLGVYEEGKKWYWSMDII